MMWLLPCCRLRVREMVAAVQQVASGLTEMHEKGLLHNDLRAANVLQVPGQAALDNIDLGNAVEMQKPDGSPNILPQLL